jgi:hypothetical protein
MRRRTFNLAGAQLVRALGADSSLLWLNNFSLGPGDILASPGGVFARRAALCPTWRNAL